jgi:hypothetical protein
MLRDLVEQNHPKKMLDGNFARNIIIGIDRKIIRAL